MLPVLPHRPVVLQDERETRTDTHAKARQEGVPDERQGTRYSHNHGIERANRIPATINPSIASAVTNFKRRL